MSEVLQTGGLEFEVRRSERRKTLGLTVDRAGELVAHVPAESSPHEIGRWIEGKLLWVHQKLALKEVTTPKLRAPEYVTGEAFCYLGKRYRLKVVRQQDRPFRFDGTSFMIRLDACPSEQHFRRWYIATGSEWISRRVEMLSARTGSAPERVEVRELGFRWGSCSRSRVLYFNWKVLQLPVRLIDYVVTHELLHLSDGHHGPEFYAAFSRAMPTWQARKDELASRAKEYLIFGLTK